MDNRRNSNRFKPLEHLVEQANRSSSDSSLPDASERFRRSLYESPHGRQQELNEGRTTQESSWQTEAREGFQRFDRSYRNGDANWKRFLTQTEHGRELQAVYLGIKPVMSIYPDEIHDEQMVDMIHHYAKQDFSVLDLRSIGGSLMLFSEKNVDKVLRNHPVYFPMYDKASSVSSYLSELGQHPVTSTEEQMDIQRGLLHGFPIRPSEQYAQHKDAIASVADLYEVISPQETEEKRLLQGYLGVNDLATRNFDQINTFRDTHQNEMRQLLDRHLRYMPEEKKQYVLQLRYMHAPGIYYASDHPTSPEEQTLIQRANDTFKFSGIDDYLNSAG